MFVGEGISLSLYTKTLTKRFKLDSEFDILLANIPIILIYMEDDKYEINQRIYRFGRLILRLNCVCKLTLVTVESGDSMKGNPSQDILRGGHA